MNAIVKRYLPKILDGIAMTALSSAGIFFAFPILLPQTLLLATLFSMAFWYWSRKRRVATMASIVGAFLIAAFGPFLLSAGPVYGLKKPGFDRTRVAALSGNDSFKGKVVQFADPIRSSAFKLLDWISETKFRQLTIDEIAGVSFIRIPLSGAFEISGGNKISLATSASGVREVFIAHSEVSRGWKYDVTIKNSNGINLAVGRFTGLRSLNVNYRASPAQADWDHVARWGSDWSAPARTAALLDHSLFSLSVGDLSTGAMAVDEAITLAEDEFELGRLLFLGSEFAERALGGNLGQLQTIPYALESLEHIVRSVAKAGPPNASLPWIANALRTRLMAYGGLYEESMKKLDDLVTTRVSPFDVKTEHEKSDQFETLVKGNDLLAALRLGAEETIASFREPSATDFVSKMEDQLFAMSYEEFNKAGRDTLDSPEEARLFAHLAIRGIGGRFLTVVAGAMNKLVDGNLVAQAQEISDDYSRRRPVVETVVRSLNNPWKATYQSWLAEEEATFRAATAIAAALVGEESEFDLKDFVPFLVDAGVPNITLLSLLASDEDAPVRADKFFAVPRSAEGARWWTQRYSEFFAQSCQNGLFYWFPDEFEEPFPTVGFESLVPAPLFTRDGAGLAFLPGLYCGLIVADAMSGADIGALGISEVTKQRWAEYEKDFAQAFEVETKREWLDFADLFLVTVERVE